MCPASDPSIDELLAAARAQFARSLAQKAAQLGALAACGDWQAVKQAAHKLRGSAASYGFAAFGAAAAAIEDLLLETDGEPGSEDRARVAQLGRTLVEEAARANPMETGR